MAILFDALGNPIFPVAPTGSYIAHISIRHTVADPAGSMVWAMRNPLASPRALHVRNIRGRLSFDGTAVAAANIGYEFVRFTGADPTTGTTVPRVKKRSGYGPSVVQDANIQQKSGVLTMTGVANIEILNVVRLPAAVTNGVAPFDLDFVVANQPYEALELEPGAGVGIRVGPNAAIIGQTIAGSVEWDER